MAYDGVAIGALLDAIGERSPTPASGAAIAVAGALAAATAELAARFVDDAGAVEQARELRSRLLALGSDDAAAYAAFMDEPSEENRSRTIDVPLTIAEAAAWLVRLARSLEARLDPKVATDAAAAAILARAVAAAACRLVAVNAPAGDVRAARAEALAAQAARL